MIDRLGHGFNQRHRPCHRGHARAAGCLRHPVRPQRSARERAEAEIRATCGKAEFVQADLINADGARELALRALSVTGSIDILVNNAGIYPFYSTIETDEELFDAVYNLNVKVPFFLTAELVPAMLERGHGSIINLSTIAARKGLPGDGAYGSSKAAVDQLTRTWASEYGPSGGAGQRRRARDHRD